MCTDFFIEPTSRLLGSGVGSNGWSTVSSPAVSFGGPEDGNNGSETPVNWWFGLIETVLVSGPRPFLVSEEVPELQ